MKRKEIEFDAEELVGSVEVFAAQVRKGRKRTLRAFKLTLSSPIQVLRPKGIAALRRTR